MASKESSSRDLPGRHGKQGTPKPDPAVYDCGLPVLGICYGFHQLTLADDGEVKPLPHREYGRSKVIPAGKDPLFDGVPADFQSWMSHGDSVSRLGKNYRLIAESENGVPAAAAHMEKPLWGVQYHPEASHCEYGYRVLENFACRICGAKKEWTLEQYIDQETVRIRELAGDRDVLLLISGGVDSTVAAALLLKALDHSKVWLMYVDTGMMRKGESEEVARNLRVLGAEHLCCSLTRKSGF